MTTELQAGLQKPDRNPETPQLVWTAGGLCFGYKADGFLFTHDGFQVGRIYGDEVYGCDGKYLGEFSRDESQRLQTHSYKKGLSKPGFSPSRAKKVTPGPVRAPRTLYTGYAEFPAPDLLREQVSTTGPAGGFKDDLDPAWAAWKRTSKRGAAGGR